MNNNSFKQHCKGWNASLSEKQICRGTKDSSKGLENEAPPTVIGEEEIDMDSALWKDENESLVYKKGRSDNII